MWDKGPLRVLNDQSGKWDALYLESYRTFKGPLFNKPVTAGLGAYKTSLGNFSQQYSWHDFRILLIWSPMWQLAWSMVMVVYFVHVGWNTQVTPNQTALLNIPYSFGRRVHPLPNLTVTLCTRGDQGFSRPVKGGISIGVRTVDLDHHWRHPPPHPQNILLAFSISAGCAGWDEIGDRGILWVWIRRGWSRDNGMESQDHVARARR